VRAEQSLDYSVCIILVFQHAATTLYHICAYSRLSASFVTLLLLDCSVLVRRKARHISNTYQTLLLLYVAILYNTGALWSDLLLNWSVFEKRASMLCSLLILTGKFS
jgi:hypothetical protein